MTGAALDTNVLQAILQAGHPLQEYAKQALKRAQKRKPFILCPVVFAEAHGIPGFDGDIFQAFLGDLGAERLSEKSQWSNFFTIKRIIAT